jgi:hypothetical protein
METRPGGCPIVYDCGQAGGCEGPWSSNKKGSLASFARNPFRIMAERLGFLAMLRNVLKFLTSYS